MADLTVGISKAAVEALVSKVQSAIKEDAEKWQTVQRDLVFITGEFEMMQSFLDTASEEHVKNKIVRTWVRQVRDLSNDVEDSIDFILHIDMTKRSWWLRLLPSCGGKTGAPLPVDEAVAQTTMLRARVVDVSQRNIRYNLIVDSAPKPMSAMDLVPVKKTAASSFDILIDAVKKSGLLDLAELITRDDRDLHVVSVCGTEGDLVKVAIIRKMYSDARVQKEFQCRAWVKLMHPFNPHEFLRSLMTQFFTHFCQQQQEDVIEGLFALKKMQATQGDLDLINEFAQMINTHRYLIVLEDLYTIVQWDAIRSYLPDRRKGSRIVVLTHHPVVASHCTGEPCRVSELEQFSPGHSVSVYYKESFQHDRVHSFLKPEPYHLLFNYDFLGRDSELNALFEMAKMSHESQLISVWRMPGVGKSTLVEALYYKLRTNIEFKRHVWSNEAWDWIKSNLIQYGDSRSCIIIITPEESVAKHCAVSIDGVYNIKGLHATAAVELFEKVLGEKGCYLEHEMEEAKDIILPKCGGLPRVIITVARYLATKPRDVLKQEIRSLSDNFMQELASNTEFESLRGLLAWMQSYLDSCPCHLKKYMLYLSIFPQDIIIRQRRLIRRWVAEGYSKGTDSITMEKYAEKIFNEVSALCIMQPVQLEATKVIGYRVNGFFREYIMSRPVEETIFFPVEVSALEKQGYGRLTTEGIGQHLAIGSTWLRDQIMFESLDLSRLRSQTVFGGFRRFYVSDRMRVLRVLDLENATCMFDSDLQGIGKLPSRLKFLSLRGQRRISRLPESVGDLVQLQTLDIRGTEIRTLPPFITKLRKLQYIRAGTTVAWTDDAEVESTRPSSNRSPWTLASCLPNKFLRRDGPVVGSHSGGVEAPRGIKRLKALLTLSAVHVNTADGEAILDEIVDYLPQVSGISRKHGQWSLFFLDGKSHLESLSLQFERNNHFVHWEHIDIPKSLRSLKMYGHVEQLPRKICSRDNLVKLTLEMTTLLRAEVIEVLGSIPNLQTLRLRVNKDQDGELQFPADRFRKLHALETACKSKLHVRFDEGAMEKLEQLKLHCLEGSKMQVSGLQHPVSLKQVWLLGSFDDALKEALQQQLDMHLKIPAPKLEVQREDDNDA